MTTVPMKAAGLPRQRRIRITLLMLVGCASLLAIAQLGPIAQAFDYHRFADQRGLWGIPNFGDVASNLAFLGVGWMGIRACVRRELSGGLAELRLAYLAFFVGVVAIAFGSAYYHWAPNDDSLMWDRLPMTVSFMAFFCVVLGEHIDPRLGLRLLLPLVVLGVASVIYWHLTQRTGHGDLRPYIAIQYLPMVLVPLVLLLFPSRLSGVGYLWAMLGAYAAAKILEMADATVFALGGWISGHTLKHLAAALGMYLFLLALRKRRVIGSIARR